MFRFIRMIFEALMTQDVDLMDTHPDYYQLYFYHVEDNSLSTKRRSSTWYATMPCSWKEKGLPVVRTAVKLDRRMYPGGTSNLMGHYIMVTDAEHKHFVRTCRRLTPAKRAA